jgi:2,3,4,5-tetrahydropyridine-2-carboxylate N-succinyltransferase
LLNQKETQVNEWVKSSCYVFSYPENGNMGSWNFEYHDKMELKKTMLLKEFVVPGASARYGSYISSGVIMMPSYVNIGAYVDEGTMVDTWGQ